MFMGDYFDLECVGDGYQFKTIHSTSHDSPSRVILACAATHWYGKHASDCLGRGALTLAVDENFLSTEGAFHSQTEKSHLGACRRVLL